MRDNNMIRSDGECTHVFGGSYLESVRDAVWTMKKIIGTHNNEMITSDQIRLGKVRTF